MSARRPAKTWRVLTGLLLVLPAALAWAPTHSWPSGHWCIHDLIHLLDTLFISPGG